MSKAVNSKKKIQYAVTRIKVKKNKEKINMNIIHNLFFTVSLAALMSGCNSEIDLVKNGTLQGREQTTIGKAIESAMGDVQWNYFETDKGVRVVEVRGWLGQTEYTNIIEVLDYCFKPEKKQIVIQFRLLVNQDAFDVSYCGKGEERLDCSTLLNFIYNEDISFNKLKENCALIRENIMIEPLARDEETGLYSRPIAIKGDGWESWLTFNGFFNTREKDKMCPSGWRLPTREEFSNLLDKERTLAEKITFSRHLFALHDYLFIGDNRANGYKNWFLGDVDDDRNYVSCIQDLEVFKSNVDKDDPRRKCGEDYGCFNEKCEWICE